jgi:transcriptional regulator with XRE-family HTH domain
MFSRHVGRFNRVVQLPNKLVLTECDISGPLMVSPATIPKWSKDIKSLRSELKLSQVEFGKRLKCSSMAVSRWERGELPPSAHYYLGIAKIAGHSFGWRFWNLAGITERDVQRMPDHRARTKNGQQHLSNAITFLEAEVARSESRAARRDALFSDLSTLELRREYKAIARAEAKFARLVARHIQMLKRVVS